MPQRKTVVVGGSAHYNGRGHMISGWNLAGISAAMLSLLLLPDAGGQEIVARGNNPFDRDPAAVEAGQGLYLDRCGVCHGRDARGSMAASLVRSRTVARGSDAALFKVIANGFPGTEMPAQRDLEPKRIWQLVSYLHSLSRPGQQPPPPGDPEAGKRVFGRAGCSGCHQIDGTGGFFGPPLDSIAARKTSDRIRSDVLDPSAEPTAGYQAVIVVTQAGERLRGILKNEDTFSVQILLPDGRFRLLDRHDIAEFGKPGTSAMPADFKERLSEDGLQNLLAYLDQQRDAFIPALGGFSNY